MRNNKKEDGSKYSILLFIQITVLFRGLLLGKLSKTFSKIDVY